MPIDYSKFDSIDDDDSSEWRKLDLEDFEDLDDPIFDEMGMGLGHDLGYELDPGIESEHLDFQELREQASC